jgi:hypothetical protein
MNSSRGSKSLPGTGRGTARSAVEGALPLAPRPEEDLLRQPLRGCHLPVPGRI